jgi:hypothetical protein
MDQDTSVQSESPATEEQDPDDPEVKYADKLAELRAKHGKIGYWELHGHGLVVCTKPKAVVFRKYVNDLHNDKLDKALVQEEYALRCIVHPDRAAAKRIFEDMPAFVTRVAGRASKLGGGDAQDLGKD